MNWTEIKINISSADVDRVAAIANMSVPYGIYIEDYSDLVEQSWEIAHIDLIEQELLEKDKNSAVVHIYISEEDNAIEATEYIRELLLADHIKFEIITELVNDSSWADGWKKFFKCTEIGERLVIRPSWEEYDNKDGRVVLSIDPGAAFGTGTHATTSLCLGILQEYVNEKTSILDIGCGSGILSIAGVLLGAQKAVGVDIDAQSVRVAKENAELNNVADKTEYLVGDLADKVSGKYSIVCANIVADVILKLLENVGEFMEDSAVLITSGIIDMRRDDVVDGFKRFGYSIVKEHIKDNWHAFVCRKDK